MIKILTPPLPLPYTYKGGEWLPPCPPQGLHEALPSLVGEGQGWGQYHPISRPGPEQLPVGGYFNNHRLRRLNRFWLRTGVILHRFLWISAAKAAITVPESRLSNL